MSVAGRLRRKVIEPRSNGEPAADADRDHADLAGADLACFSFRGERMRFATLTGANLESADLSHTDLLHAQINRARLNGADLTDARLDHANFTGADLTGAKLGCATLRFGILSNAKIACADLSGANLLHARFDGADLSQTNLQGARLDHAVFAGAKLAGADLRGTNLRYVRNLSAAQVAAALTDEATVLPAKLVEAAYGEASETVRCRPERRESDRAAAGLAALLVAAAAGIKAGLHNPRIWLSVVVMSAVLGGLVGWHYFRLEPLEPSPATDRIDATTAKPEAIPGVADAAALKAPKKTPVAHMLLPETVAAVPAFEAKAGAETPAPVPLASEPVVIAALLSEENAGPSSPPETELAPSVGAAPQAAPPATEASWDDMRPVPLANAMRSRSMRAVKVSLRFAPQAGPEALVTPAAVQPAEVRAREARADEAGLIPPPPMTLVVSLNDQRIDVYQGTSLLTSSKVSSGMAGHETRAGVFSILQKKERHESNIYSAAPMPWMQRLTRSGIALHAGVVPGYPASHGCVRLPTPFATKLYGITELGANVVIAREAIAPRPIEHPNLLQPLGAAAADALEARGEFNPHGAAGSINAPLRILVARRTARDELLDVQRILADLGYLKPWDFLGQMEGETKDGITAFQRANGLSLTGRMTPDFVAKVYEVAGKPQPPAGHLFVRQDFHRLYDVPIVIRAPEQPLGTHLFAMRSLAGKQAQWLGLSLEGDDPISVLDRIELPETVRKDIAARLTPDSTLIVADITEDSPILSEGDDFIVWTGDDWNGEGALKVNQPVTAPIAKIKSAKAASAPAKEKRRAPAPASYEPPGRAAPIWKESGRW